MSMDASQSNFDTLIVAGVGTIGSSVVKLGQSVLQSFKKVILVDLDAARLTALRNRGVTCLQGSVEDTLLIEKITEKVEGKGLFVNLCADVDNLRIRRMLAPRNLAYVDSCAGSGRDLENHSFSSIMDYTMTPVESRCPQWLCWGINPGMVEIIVRKIIRESSWARGKLNVTVFEHDQLEAESFNDKIAVGWCPSAFIEEMMLYPTLEVIDGMPREACNTGPRQALAFWCGTPVASRIVAHEDIWNMSKIDGVEESCFVYGLHPKVMAILNRTPQEAEDILQVPPKNVPVFGLEQVAVMVSDAATGQRKTLFWQTDHHRTWEEDGINAVQFQTATSMLLAVQLLQQTHYGMLPGNYCAADLPIFARDWQKFSRFMSMLDMEWENGDHLNLSFRRL